MHAPRNLHVKDEDQVILLIIDPQVQILLNSSFKIYFYCWIITQIDFHEGGSLAVPGAHADALRIKEMIL